MPASLIATGTVLLAVFLAGLAIGIVAGAFAFAVMAIWGHGEREETR